MTNLFKFSWEVSIDGYQLIFAKVGPVACGILTSDLPLGDKYYVRKTEPLQRQTLFHEFADLDSPESILAFANQHGLLGLPPREATLPGDRAGDCFTIRGELVSDWQQQAKWLRKTIGSWQRGQHRAVAEAVTPFLSGVSPRFVSDAERSGLVFEPHNLLAAIWLQFALAVEGRKQFTKCGGCDAWIDRGRYCDAACRQRAYRRRKKVSVK